MTCFGDLFAHFCHALHPIAIKIFRITILKNDILSVPMLIIYINSDFKFFGISFHWITYIICSRYIGFWKGINLLPFRLWSLVMYVSFSKRCRFQLNLIKLLNVGFVNNVLTNPKAELLKVFNLPPSKILSFYIFLKMNANHAFQNCKNCVSQNLLLNPSSHQFSTILLKPPSITSQIANLPHGWNPHTRSFFATRSVPK